nr:uncharacterized protein LOC105105215 [Camelus dromedarius]
MWKEVGGERKEAQPVPIPGNTNDAVLRNLQPDVPDTVTVVPLYPEGDGGHTPDTGRTWNGERTGQKCPSVQSTEQRGHWLDPAPGWCSSTTCVRSPGWHEAPGTSPARGGRWQENRREVSGCRKAISQIEKRLTEVRELWGFRHPSERAQEYENPVPGYHVRKRELTPFHKAAYFGHLDTAEVLLLYNENVVDSRDRKNRTALHLACNNGQSSVVSAPHYIGIVSECS